MIVQIHILNLAYNCTSNVRYYLSTFKTDRQPNTHISLIQINAIYKCSDMKNLHF